MVLPPETNANSAVSKEQKIIQLPCGLTIIAEGQLVTLINGSTEEEQTGFYRIRSLFDPFPPCASM